MAAPAASSSAPSERPEWALCASPAAEWRCAFHGCQNCRRTQAAHRPGSPQAALPQLRLPQRYEGETWVLLPLVNFRNYMWGLGGGIEGSRRRSLVAPCIGLSDTILAPCPRRAILKPIWPFEH